MTNGEYVLSGLMAMLKKWKLLIIIREIYYDEEKY
jgi:hypothetical protein